MSLESEFKKIQEEGALRDAHFALRTAQKLLAGALCAQCGEPLGDTMPVQVENVGEDPRTVHQGCETAALEEGEATEDQPDVDDSVDETNYDPYSGHDVFEHDYIDES